ncbi:MAG: hypothetical protein OXF42_02825 [Candidatus Dadabacteria bacterium]|nr:hypothetical protein [Candidatus Dadabacteria bacterium]
MFCVTIKGETPLIMHSGEAGLDTRSPANLEKAEIARKKGSNRTEADEARLRELECQSSLWLDENDQPTIPHGAIRRMIENGARKSKQGGDVREGLVVAAVKFDYDRKTLGKTLEELSRKAQFTVPVVVQRSRLLRTRAKFDQWSAEFVLDTDDELIDKPKLEKFLDVGGRRVGLGDWRPEKSGHYGRFTIENIEEVKEKPDWA